MKTELAISTGFARAEFKDKICVLIFYVFFPTLFVSSAYELKAINTKEEYRIISDEHLGHFLVAMAMVLGFMKSYAVPD
jgi:hypothetical protein